MYRVDAKLGDGSLVPLMEFESREVAEAVAESMSAQAKDWQYVVRS